MTKYDRLSIRCDISETSLTEALVKLGLMPPMVELHVAPGLPFVETARILKVLAGDTVSNVLAPRINLYVDPDLDPGEWYVQHGIRKVGSKGA